MSQYRYTSNQPLSPGFTLIELMIVIAIIAILISLAVPAYQDYTIRTRVSEAISVAASAKLAVAETCQSDPSVTPSNASTGYSFSSSEFVQSVTISHTCLEPWIVIRTHNTGAAPNMVVSLDGFYDPGSGRVAWNCHRVAGRERHLPPGCRGGHHDH